MGAANLPGFPVARFAHRDAEGAKAPGATFIRCVAADFKVAALKRAATKSFSRMRGHPEHRHSSPVPR